jgi:thymidylate synthase ThyX
MITAEIICDSVNEHNCRLTTFVLTFPRIVLSEFNTHRALSRNSASSRAVPFKKMLELVKTNPFVPIKWMKDHTGMQGTEYLNLTEAVLCNEAWLEARNAAINQAMIMNQWGLTKQICNRLLEPFMWHKVICTGTDFENFFALRADDAAEIHIQDLSFKMLEAYNSSTPKKLKAGEWHIPFGDQFDDKRVLQAYQNIMNEAWGVHAFDGVDYNKVLSEYKLKIATARCARVSYNNFEGKDDYNDDLKLYDRLLVGGHMSPFEHCSRSMTNLEYIPSYGQCGNFRGFIQLRKTIENENKTDNRVKSYEQVKS